MRTPRTTIRRRRNWARPPVVQFAPQRKPAAAPRFPDAYSAVVHRAPRLERRM